MSTVIPPDFIVDEALAKRLIEEQFNFTVAQCSIIGAGFDNVVFLINEHLVFRFPRRIIAIELIEHEIRLLEGLSRLLKMPIPKPRYIGVASNNYEAPFYGHEFLNGLTGCKVKLSLKEQHELAHDLGSFLHTLHRVDIRDLPLAPDDLKPLFDRVDKTQMTTWLHERFLNIKDIYNLHTLQPKIDGIVRESESYIPRQNAPVLVHGDLYHRHLLFDNEHRLSGIIDWGDSCLSDRVVDFIVVYQLLAKECHETFFKSYGDISDEEKAYARFLGLYYAVTLLWYGHDGHDNALINTSLMALQHI